MYIKEFVQTGIDAHQLVNFNRNFKVYDGLTVDFNLISNNRSSVEYTNSISAIPQQWNLNLVFCSDKTAVIENFIEKLRFNGKTAKSSYCFLFSKLISGPAKQ